MSSESSQQESFINAEPQPEHLWLRQLVGEWAYEAEGMSASGDIDRAEGSESVRSLGDLWFLAEGSGTMPDGSPATTLMTLGYEPRTGRYVGTWIGSMMTHLWLYEGTVDAAGTTLTLEAEGPSMTGDGGMARYRDVIELQDDDHRTLRSFLLGAEGEWQEFMVAHYRRTS